MKSSRVETQPPGPDHPNHPNHPCEHEVGVIASYIAIYMGHFVLANNTDILYAIS